MNIFIVPTPERMDSDRRALPMMSKDFDSHGLVTIEQNQIARRATVTSTSENQLQAWKSQSPSHIGESLQNLTARVKHWENTERLNPTCVASQAKQLITGQKQPVVVRFLYNPVVDSTTIVYGVLIKITCHFLYTSNYTEIRGYHIGLAMPDYFFQIIQKSRTDLYIYS